MMTPWAVIGLITAIAALTWFSVIDGDRIAALERRIGVLEGRP